MATLAARQLPAFPDIACLLASFILVNFYLVSQRREKNPSASASDSASVSLWVTSRDLERLSRNLRWLVYVFSPEHGYKSSTTDTDSFRQLCGWVAPAVHLTASDWLQQTAIKLSGNGGQRTRDIGTRTKLIETHVQRAVALTCSQLNAPWIRLINWCHSLELF